MAEKTNMRPRSVTRLIREGEFVAEVTVQLIETEQGSGWAPYLSLDDAYRLDDVRAALRAGDVQQAARLADHLFRLIPVRSRLNSVCPTHGVSRCPAALYRNGSRTRF